MNHQVAKEAKINTVPLDLADVQMPNRHISPHSTYHTSQDLQWRQNLMMRQAHDFYALLSDCGGCGSCDHDGAYQ